MVCSFAGEIDESRPVYLKQKFHFFDFQLDRRTNFPELPIDRPMTSRY